MENEIAKVEMGAHLSVPGIHAAMVTTREMSEIQAMVISAKRFPRDLTQVRADILASCDSPALAEVSQYTYAKGGTEVNGPSIRLAEELAGAFQNMDKGWREIERKNSQGNVPGESVIECFAWDLQRNVKAKRTFTVRHWRDTKKGSYALKDEREIYELCANQAARRLRACILEIIPRYLQDEAVGRCDETLKKNAKGGNLEKRIADMVAAFDKIGATKEMLEKRLQHKVEATSESEIIGLHKVYSSLVDGMSTLNQWFEAGQAVITADGAANSMNANKTAEDTPPATQSISKKGKTSAKKESAVAPASESVDRNSVGPQSAATDKENTLGHKEPVKNFATPEGIDELKRQREAKEGAARAEKKKADAASFDVPADPQPAAPASTPPVDEKAPTFQEIWSECASACRSLGWSPIRLAEFTKEKFGKSPAQMQREDNVKQLCEVYETLLQQLENGGKSK